MRKAHMHKNCKNIYTMQDSVRMEKLNKSVEDDIRDETGFRYYLCLGNEMSFYYLFLFYGTFGKN